MDSYGGYGGYGSYGGSYDPYSCWGSNGGTSSGSTNQNDGGSGGGGGSSYCSYPQYSGNDGGWSINTGDGGSGGGSYNTRDGGSGGSGGGSYYGRGSGGGNNQDGSSGGGSQCNLVQYDDHEYNDGSFTCGTPQPRTCEPVVVTININRRPVVGGLVNATFYEDTVVGAIPNGTITPPPFTGALLFDADGDALARAEVTVSSASPDHHLSCAQFLCTTQSTSFKGTTPKSTKMTGQYYNLWEVTTPGATSANCPYASPSCTVCAPVAYPAGLSCEPDAATTVDGGYGVPAARKLVFVSTGGDTTANFQGALRTIFYVNTGGDNVNPAGADVLVQLWDVRLDGVPDVDTNNDGIPDLDVGTNSLPVVNTVSCYQTCTRHSPLLHISVVPYNNPPVVVVIPNAAIVWQESADNTPVYVGLMSNETTFTITDVDSGVATVTLALSSGGTGRLQCGNGATSAAAVAGFTCQVAAGGKSITLSWPSAGGGSTSAAVSAISQVFYTDDINTPDAGSYSVLVTVVDAALQAGQVSPTFTVAVTVNSYNDTPTVTGALLSPWTEQAYQSVPFPLFQGPTGTVIADVDSFDRIHHVDVTLVPPSGTSTTFPGHLMCGALPTAIAESIVIENGAKTAALGFAPSTFRATVASSSSNGATLFFCEMLENPTGTTGSWTVPTGATSARRLTKRVKAGKGATGAWNRVDMTAAEATAFLQASVSYFNESNLPRPGAYSVTVTVVDDGDTGAALGNYPTPMTANVSLPFTVSSFEDPLQVCILGMYCTTTDLGAAASCAWPNLVCTAAADVEPSAGCNCYSGSNYTTLQRVQMNPPNPAVYQPTFVPGQTGVVLFPIQNATWEGVLANIPQANLYLINREYQDQKNVTLGTVITAGDVVPSHDLLRSCTATNGTCATILPGSWTTYLTAPPSSRALSFTSIPNLSKLAYGYDNTVPDASNPADQDPRVVQLQFRKSDTQTAEKRAEVRLQVLFKQVPAIIIVPTGPSSPPTPSSAFIEGDNPWTPVTLATVLGTTNKTYTNSFRLSVLDRGTGFQNAVNCSPTQSACYFGQIQLTVNQAGQGLLVCNSTDARVGCTSVSSSTVLLYFKTSVYDSTNKITLTLDQQVALVNQAINDFVLYSNRGDDPKAGTSNYTVSIWDLAGDKATITVNFDVVPVNDVPVIAVTSAPTYLEQSDPIPIFTTPTVALKDGDPSTASDITQPENRLVQLKVTLAGGATGLSCSGATGQAMTCAVSAGGNVVTLTSPMPILPTSVVAAMVALVRYQNTSCDALQSGSVGATVAVTDELGATGQSPMTITLTGIFDPPKLANTTTVTDTVGETQFNPNGYLPFASGSVFDETTTVDIEFGLGCSPTSLTDGCDAFDGAKDVLQTLVLSVAAGYPQSALSCNGLPGPVQPPPGTTVTCQATATSVTLSYIGTGTNDVPDVSLALKSLLYTNTGLSLCGGGPLDANQDTVLLSVTLTDTANESWSLANKFSLGVTTVNSAPVVTNATFVDKHFLEQYSDNGAEDNQHVPMAIFAMGEVRVRDVDSCDLLASVSVQMTPPATTGDLGLLTCGTAAEAVSPLYFDAATGALMSLPALVPGSPYFQCSFSGTGSSSLATVTKVVFKSTGTFAPTTMTEADAAAALTLVRYENESDHPVAGQYTVQVKVTDAGDHGSDHTPRDSGWVPITQNGYSFDVTPSNDPPVYCTDPGPYYHKHPPHVTPAAAFAPVTCANAANCGCVSAVTLTDYSDFVEAGAGGVGANSAPLLVGSEIPYLDDADLVGPWTMTIVLLCNGQCHPGDTIYWTDGTTRIDGTAVNDTRRVVLTATTVDVARTLLQQLVYYSTDDHPRAGYRDVLVTVADPLNGTCTLSSKIQITPTNDTPQWNGRYDCFAGGNNAVNLTLKSTSTFSIYGGSALQSFLAVNLAPALGSCTVVNVAVQATITHPLVSDLAVNLRAPKGQSAKLQAGLPPVAWSSVAVKYQDGGPAAPTTALSSTSVVMAPLTPLATTFAGIDPTGIWTLELDDSEAGQTTSSVGTLNGWGVVFSLSCSAPNTTSPCQDYTAQYTEKDVVTPGPDRGVSFTRLLGSYPTYVQDDSALAAGLKITIQGTAASTDFMYDMLTCGTTVYHGTANCAQGSAWDVNRYLTPFDGIACGQAALRDASGNPTPIVTYLTPDIACTYVYPTLTIAPATSTSPPLTLSTLDPLLGSVYFSTWTDAPSATPRTVALSVTDVPDADNYCPTSCTAPCVPCAQTGGSTVYVNVTPTNDPPPVVTCPGLSLVEQVADTTGPIFCDSSTSVTDYDSPLQEILSVYIVITKNFDATQDELLYVPASPSLCPAVDTSATPLPSSQGVLPNCQFDCSVAAAILGNPLPSTPTECWQAIEGPPATEGQVFVVWWQSEGRLSIKGTVTLSHDETTAILKRITYDNPSNTPSGLQRIATVTTFDDSGVQNTVINVPIQITPISDPPKVNLATNWSVKWVESPDGRNVTVQLLPPAAYVSTSDIPGGLHDPDSYVQAALSMVNEGTGTIRCFDATGTTPATTAGIFTCLEDGDGIRLVRYMNGVEYGGLDTDLKAALSYVFYQDNNQNPIEANSPPSIPVTLTLEDMDSDMPLSEKYVSTSFTLYIQSYNNAPVVDAPLTAINFSELYNQGQAFDVYPAGSVLVSDVDSQTKIQCAQAQLFAPPGSRDPGQLMCGTDPTALAKAVAVDSVGTTVLALAYSLTTGAAVDPATATDATLAFCEVQGYTRGTGGAWSLTGTRAIRVRHRTRATNGTATWWADADMTTADAAALVEAYLLYFNTSDLPRVTTTVPYQIQLTVMDDGDNLNDPSPESGSGASQLTITDFEDPLVLCILTAACPASKLGQAANCADPNVLCPVPQDVLPDLACSCYSNNPQNRYAQFTTLHPTPPQSAPYSPTYVEMSAGVNIFPVQNAAWDPTVGTGFNSVPLSHVYLIDWETADGRGITASVSLAPGSPTNGEDLFTTCTATSGPCGAALTAGQLASFTTFPSAGVVQPLSESAALATISYTHDNTKPDAQDLSDLRPREVKLEFTKSLNNDTSKRAQVHVQVQLQPVNSPPTISVVPTGPSSPSSANARFIEGDTPWTPVTLATVLGATGNYFRLSVSDVEQRGFRNAPSCDPTQTTSACYFAEVSLTVNQTGQGHLLCPATTVAQVGCALIDDFTLRFYFTDVAFTNGVLTPAMAQQEALIGQALNDYVVYSNRGDDPTAGTSKFTVTLWDDGDQIDAPASTTLPVPFQVVPVNDVPVIVTTSAPTYLEQEDPIAVFVPGTTSLKDGDSSTDADVTKPENRLVQLDVALPAGKTGLSCAGVSLGPLTCQVLNSGNAVRLHTATGTATPTQVVAAMEGLVLYQSPDGDAQQSGTLSVAVTVTDDMGATGQSSCAITLVGIFDPPRLSYTTEVQRTLAEPQFKNGYELFASGNILDASTFVPIVWGLGCISESLVDGCDACDGAHDVMRTLTLTVTGNAFDQHRLYCNTLPAMGQQGPNDLVTCDTAATGAGVTLTYLGGGGDGRAAMTAAITNVLYVNTGSMLCGSCLYSLANGSFESWNSAFPAAFSEWTIESSMKVFRLCSSSAANYYTTPAFVVPTGGNPCMGMNYFASLLGSNQSTTPLPDGAAALDLPFDGSGGKATVMSSVYAPMTDKVLRLHFHINASLQVGAQARHFSIMLQDVDGNELQRTLVLSAEAGQSTTVVDANGNSAFIGYEVPLAAVTAPFRIVIESSVPEAFTGPGELIVDNLVFAAPNDPWSPNLGVVAPSPSPSGLSCVRTAPLATLPQTYLNARTAELATLASGRRLREYEDWVLPVGHPARRRLMAAHPQICQLSARNANADGFDLQISMTDTANETWTNKSFHVQIATVNDAPVVRPTNAGFHVKHWVEFDPVKAVPVNRGVPFAFLLQDEIRITDVDSCDRIQRVDVSLAVPANATADVGALMCGSDATATSPVLYNPATMAPLPATSVATGGTVLMCTFSGQGSASTVTFLKRTSNGQPDMTTWPAVDMTQDEANSAVLLLRYFNASTNPQGGQYTVTIKVTDDGDHGSDTAPKSTSLALVESTTLNFTFDVTPYNDPPRCGTPPAACPPDIYLSDNVVFVEMGPDASGTDPCPTCTNAARNVFMVDAATESAPLLVKSTLPTVTLLNPATFSLDVTFTGPTSAGDPNDSLVYTSASGVAQTGTSLHFVNQQMSDIMGVILPGIQLRNPSDTPLGGLREFTAVITGTTSVITIHGKILVVPTNDIPKWVAQAPPVQYIEATSAGAPGTCAAGSGPDRSVTFMPVWPNLKVADDSKLLDRVVFTIAATTSPTGSPWDLLACSPPGAAPTLGSCVPSHWVAVSNGASPPVSGYLAPSDYMACVQNLIYPSANPASGRSEVVTYLDTAQAFKCSFGKDGTPTLVVSKADGSGMTLAELNAQMGGVSFSIWYDHPAAATRTINVTVFDRADPDAVGCKAPSAAGNVCDLKKDGCSWATPPPDLSCAWQVPTTCLACPQKSATMPVTVSITPKNDPPAVSTCATLNVLENPTADPSPGNLFCPGTTITDYDDTDTSADGVSSISVVFTSGYQPTEDLLSVADGTCGVLGNSTACTVTCAMAASDTGDAAHFASATQCFRLTNDASGPTRVYAAWSAGPGTLYIRAGGVMSAATAAVAMQRVLYVNTAPYTPKTNPRLLTATVVDGPGACTQVQITATITPENDPPHLTNLPDTVQFYESGLWSTEYTPDMLNHDTAVGQGAYYWDPDSSYSMFALVTIALNYSGYPTRTEDNLGCTTGLMNEYVQSLQCQVAALYGYAMPGCPALTGPAVCQGSQLPDHPCDNSCVDAASTATCKSLKQSLLDTTAYYESLGSIEGLSLRCDFAPVTGALYICWPRDPNTLCYKEVPCADGSGAICDATKLPPIETYAIPIPVMNAVLQTIYYENTNDNPNPTPRRLSYTVWDCYDDVDSGMTVTAPGGSAITPPPGSTATLPPGELFTPAPGTTVHPRMCKCTESDPQKCFDTALDAQLNPTIIIHRTNDRPGLLGQGSGVVVYEGPDPTSGPSFTKVLTDVKVVMIDSLYIQRASIEVQQVTAGEDELACLDTTGTPYVFWCVSTDPAGAPHMVPSTQVTLTNAPVPSSCNVLALPIACGTAAGCNVSQVPPACYSIFTAVGCATQVSASTQLAPIPVSCIWSKDAASGRYALIIERVGVVDTLAPGATTADGEAAGPHGLRGPEATMLVQSVGYRNDNPHHATCCATCPATGPGSQRRLQVTVYDQVPIDVSISNTPDPTPNATWNPTVTELAPWFLGRASTPLNRDLAFENYNNKPVLTVPGTGGTSDGYGSAALPIQRSWVEVNGPSVYLGNLPSEQYNGFVYLLPNLQMSDDSTWFQFASFEITGNFHGRQIDQTTCNLQCPNGNCGCSAFSGPVEDLLFCDPTAASLAPWKGSLPPNVQCQWQFDETTNTGRPRLVIQGFNGAYVKPSDLLAAVQSVGYKNTMAFPHWGDSELRAITFTVADSDPLQADPKGEEEQCAWQPTGSASSSLYLTVHVQPHLDDVLFFENMQWSMCTAPDCIQTRNPICQDHQWSWGPVMSLDASGKSTTTPVTMMVGGKPQVLETVVFVPQFKPDGTPYVQPATFCGPIPTMSQSCPFDQCPRFQWVTSAWSPCSATCNPQGTTLTGTRTRSGFCKAVGLPFYVPPSQAGCSQWTTADMNSTVLQVITGTVSKCTCMASDVPALVSQCTPTTSCQAYQIESGQWSSCSAYCGSGSKYRVGACYHYASTGKTQASWDQCFAASTSGTGMTSTDPSNPWKCPDFNVGSKCTLTSGGVTRQCQVSSSNGFLTCVEKAACNTGACPSYFWDFQACDNCDAQGWGPCQAAPGAAACSDGQRTRTAQCMLSTANSVAPTTDLDCENNGIPRPIESQFCVAQCGCSAPIAHDPSGIFLNGTCSGDQLTCDPGYHLESVSTSSGTAWQCAQDPACPKDQFYFYGPMVGSSSPASWMCCAGIDKSGACCGVGIYADKVRRVA